MEKQTTKIELELDTDDGSLRGRATSGGRTHPVSGWIGLVAVISGLLDKSGPSEEGSGRNQK